MVSVLRGVNVEKRYDCKGVLLTGKKQTVHKNEVSILMPLPVKWGLTVLNLV